MGLIGIDGWIDLKMNGPKEGVAEGEAGKRWTGHPSGFSLKGTGRANWPKSKEVVWPAERMESGCDAHRRQEMIGPHLKYSSNGPQKIKAVLRR